MPGESTQLFFVVRDHEITYHYQLFRGQLKSLERTQSAERCRYRHKESGMREEWLRAVRNTVANYRKVAEQPGDRCQFKRVVGDFFVSKNTFCCVPMFKGS